MAIKRAIKDANFQEVILVAGRGMKKNKFTKIKF